MDHGRDIIDYVVQPGDTIDSIASQYQIEEHTVRNMNHLKQGDQPAVGATLRVVQGPFYGSNSTS
ncbi:MAG: LysM peptidoglycan-binding domain-containing protein [Candidatus Nomurabacteria bacterium]|nr:MAG: LysM peptidoglycan-binding domain-containing protein [Candidatus Nomurabacteria bacterium]